jgi:hypothetical protein
MGWPDWAVALFSMGLGGVVTGIGATITMKVDQAGIRQNLVDHDRRIAACEAANNEILKSLSQVREDLAKIKGALGVRDA